MHASAIKTIHDIPDIDEVVMPNEEMEQKPQLNGISVTTIAISILALILGIVGGLLASVATNSQWKGDIEARLKAVESQRLEDKRELNDKLQYIQTQNEVNGKAMTRIEARFDSDDRRKGR